MQAAINVIAREARLRDRPCDLGNLCVSTRFFYFFVSL
jgi:hypothetical protein